MSTVRRWVELVRLALWGTTFTAEALMWGPALRPNWYRVHAMLFTETGHPAELERLSRHPAPPTSVRS